VLTSLLRFKQVSFFVLPLVIHRLAYPARWTLILRRASIALTSHLLINLCDPMCCSSQFAHSGQTIHRLLVWVPCLIE